MPFQWNNISSEWLFNQPIAYEADEIVEAFNTIERIFGGEWFASKSRGMRGPAIVIPMVDLGKVLKEIEKTPWATIVIQKMKDGQSDLHNWV